MSSTKNELLFSLDEGAFPPEKAHEADAGYDLRCPDIPNNIKYKWFAPFLSGFGAVEIDTGVHVAIPDGYVGFVMGRSGLNFKHDIIFPTGVVDSGFTGSIRAKLYSPSLFEGLEFNPGDKIAQLVVVPLANCELKQVTELPSSERGNNGFGSTGR